MKTTKLISSALISGLFLSTTAFAQERVAAQDLDNSAKTYRTDDDRADTMPVDNTAKTYPTDGDQADTMPVDTGVDSQGTAERQAPQQKSAGISRNELHFEIDGHDFRIHGGQPGEACGILVGLEMRHTFLPGGGELRIEPLLVLAQGEFDENGEYAIMIGYDAKMVGQLDYHLQAVAIDKDSGMWVTSNVQSLFFSGSGEKALADRAIGDADRAMGDKAVGDVGAVRGDNGDDDSYGDGEKARGDGGAKRAATADLEPGVTGTH